MEELKEGKKTGKEVDRDLPIESVTVVGVDGDDLESRLDQSGVKSGIGDAGGHLRRQPIHPQSHNLIVKPRNVELIVNVRLRKPEKKKLTVLD